MRTEQQGDCPLSREAPEFGECLRLSGEFRPVSFAKFRPALDIVVEPLAERRAGSQVLEPMVDHGIFIPQTSWPQAINENACSVNTGSRLVDTLQFDSRGGR
jgi:hypothetical protein